MLRRVVKTVALVAVSVVGVPYTVAFIVNLLHGWPMRRDKLKRAFHPRKVYALNYAILQQLKYLSITRLYIQWNYFYATADRKRLIKDISYGTNQCLLDLYFPEGNGSQEPRPIVIFVYGGAWGSGDKNYYGLLCCQLADKLGAVVCCPNYSIYPKGYVDDMIQDIVDCLSWLQKNAALYGGDKSKVLLVGHSAGGHLCAMATLELVVKRLQQDPDYGTQKYDLAESIRFEDKHFNGNNAENGEMEGSYCVVKQDDKDADMTDSASPPTGDENESSYQMVESQDDKETESGVKEAEEGVQGHGAAGQGHEEEPVELESVTDVPTDQDKDSQLTPHLQELRELLGSIKAIIGLAGVFHIGDHYKHESWRGVEDISKMCRAMYGPEHFDRFSPTVIANNIPDTVRLPPTVLVHGTSDTTVPSSSSVKYGEALSRFRSDVSVRLVSEASHLSVCFDLMDQRCKFHDALMGIVLETARKYLL